MKIWYVLRWACQALLAELRKLCDMILHTSFYLTAEPERIWIGVNPETVSLDANNVQSTPLDIRIWIGEGSNKSEYKAYVTLRVESVANEHATVLYEKSPESKIFAWGYTIPADKYPTANRISINAYDDEARTKEIAAKQVNIVAANPTPFPRPEEWAAGLVYKNGEYLIFGDMVYMWCSRVPGNTAVDPKTWIKNNPTSGLWKSYTEYAVLATKVFMAKFGLMGQAVFKDEYMISQQGVDADGNETWDYRKFGTDDFIPNLEFDFKTGASSFGRRNLVINKYGGINMRGSFITPYVGLTLEPDIPQILLFEGRLNAYILCNGSATEKFYFELPPASKTEPGSELNLFHYTPPGRLAPHPIARCSIGSGDVLLPANKNQLQMPATFEVKFKLVKTGYNGTDRAWYIVNHSDIPEANYSNY